MNPVELIRVFVPNEIMDDYEEVEHITENVTKLGVECGVLVRKQEIVRALISLTENGFAKAYRMAHKPGTRAEEIEGVPSPYNIQDPDPYSRCYFWATERGNEEHRRLRLLDTWPFDEERRTKGAAWMKGTA
jgi:hypothetical protein